MPRFDAAPWLFSGRNPDDSSGSSISGVPCQFVHAPSFMNVTFWVFISLATLASLPVTASAQTDIPQGITQWSTQIHAGPVSVDMATGNMIMTIHARNKPGAIPFAFDLIDNVGTQGYVNSNNTFLSSMSTGMSGLGMPVSTLCGLIGSQIKDTRVWDGTFGGFYLRDGTGSKHPFFFEQIRVGPSANCGEIGPFTSVASDGSGYTAVVTGSGTSCCLTWSIYSKDGLTLSSSGSGWTDTDNNTISASSSGTFTWTDTLNVTAMKATLGGGGGLSDQYY